MQNDIQLRLSQFSNRGMNIMNALNQSRITANPTEDIARDIISWGTGELAKDLFGSPHARRYGSKLAKESMKKEQRRRQDEINSSNEGQFNMLLEEVKSYLLSISIDKVNLTGRGNSAQVLKKISGAFKSTKLKTRISRLLDGLNSLQNESLIYNSQIVEREEQVKKKEKENSYDILKKLETALRKLIEIELSKITTSWWKQRIPQDVRESAEKRRIAREELWPWYGSGSDSLISFLDFNDYVKIITRNDNWKDAFQKVFFDKELIAAKLRELDPIRKAIAHSRDMAHRDTARLQVNAEDILSAITKYYR